MARMRVHAAHMAIQAAATVVALGWQQTAIALVVVASVTALSFNGQLDPAAAVGVYTAILGYVFGRASTVPVPDEANV